MTTQTIIIQIDSAEKRALALSGWTTEWLQAERLELDTDAAIELRATVFPLQTDDCVDLAIQIGSMSITEQIDSALQD